MSLEWRNKMALEMSPRWVASPRNLCLPRMILPTTLQDVVLTDEELGFREPKPLTRSCTARGSQVCPSDGALP